MNTTRTILTGIAIAVLAAIGLTAATDRLGAGAQTAGIDVAFTNTTPGWTRTIPTQCFVRNGTPLCRAESIWTDGDWDHDPNARWETPIANGTYNVTLAWGDPVTNHRVRVIVEGTTLVDERTDQRTHTTTAEITVTDGALTLTFGPDDRYRSALTRITATPTSSPPPASTTTAAPTTTQPPTTTTSPPSPPADTGTTYGPGTHTIDAPLVLNDGQALTGAGTGTTTIRPSASFPAGQPLVITAATSGTGTGDFTIANLTLDGDNRAAGIRVHGYRYNIDNVRVVHANGTGFHSSWLTGAFTSVPGDRPAMEAFIDDLFVEQSGTATAPGVIFAGPHDSSIHGLYVGHDLSPTPPFLVPAAIDLRAGSEGTTFHDLHTWGRSHRRGVQVGDGVHGIRMFDPYIEGARAENIWFRGGNFDSTIVGARIQCFTDFAPAATGVRYTGEAGGHRFGGRIIGCNAGGIVLDPGAGGISRYDLNVWQSPLVGTIPAGSTYTEVGA